MHQVIQTIIDRSPHLKWLEKNTVFLTLHGSRAYNTHIENVSDFDFKGITICPKEYYFGASNKFEQAELKEPDTVIYEIKKFFGLAAHNNPNVIEILFTDPSDHIFVSPIGKTILDNRNIFLSKRLKFSFSGYSIAQLKKMISHKSYLISPPTAPPTRKEMGLPERTLIPQDQFAAAQAQIKKELDKFSFDFLDGLTEPDKIGLREIMSKMLTELKITTEDQWQAAAKTIGIDDNFIYLMQLERNYLNRKNEWDKYQEWKKNRNPKRAEDERKFGYDAKNAYHLVRLLRMAREMLTTGQVIVKRPDREELLAIRNGQWKYEDIIQFAEKEDKALEELYQNCTILPHSPNMKKIDELCIGLIEKSLRGEN